MFSFLRHAYGSFEHRQTFGGARIPYFDLLWIHSGEVELTIKSQSPIELGSNSGVLIFPDTHFDGLATRGPVQASIQHFTVQNKKLPDPFAEPLGPLVRSTNGFRSFGPRMHRLEHDIQRAIDLAFVEQTSIIHAVRSALLLLTLGELLNQPTKAHRENATQRKISATAEWLEREFDRLISLGEMADHAGLSTSHFRTEFRKQLSVSPGEFHLRCRMEEAARLLRSSDLLIKQIAKQVGFLELPNFYRTFKQYSNSTPANYRAMHRLEG